MKSFILSIAASSASLDVPTVLRVCVYVWLGGMRMLACVCFFARNGWAQPSSIPLFLVRFSHFQKPKTTSTATANATTPCTRYHGFICAPFSQCDHRFAIVWPTIESETAKCCCGPMFGGPADRWSALRCIYNFCALVFLGGVLVVVDWSFETKLDTERIEGVSTLTPNDRI